jgi:hypothetical protein|tara:strand:- start:1519 stop:2853 length:1335 start_codon:yes stop_codon:yes gene_type:complete
MTNLHELHKYFESCWVLGKRDSIIENNETRILSALLWGISGVSVCIRGESGSAKTKILNATSTLFFGDAGLNGRSPDMLLLNSSSAKGQLTPDNAAYIGQTSRCVIPELQNILTSPHLEAMIKLWMEGRPYIYSRSEFGKRMIRLILEPKPILTNLADGNEFLPELPVEMQRRVVSLPTFSSRVLNERVHHMKAKSRFLPEHELNQLTRREVTQLRENCRNAMKIKTRVINPGADVVRKTIPTRYTMSNTFIGYYFDVVEAITKFHHKNRLTDGKYIFSTPEDNYLAFVLAGNIFRDMSIGIQPLGKQIIEFVPKAEVWGDLVGETETDSVHIDEIIDFLSDEGLSRAKKLVKIVLGRLVDTNFLRKIPRKDRYYRTKDVSFEQSVDWKELVTGCVQNVNKHYPHLADEYSKMSLHRYTDPYTGKRKDIPMIVKVYGGKTNDET